MTGNGMDRRAPALPSRIAGSGLQNQEHSMPRTINRLEAVATIGIGIGKNTFHLVGLDRIFQIEPLFGALLNDHLASRGIIVLRTSSCGCPDPRIRRSSR